MNVGSMFAWGSLNGKSFNWLGSHGCSCFEVERSATSTRALHDIYACAPRACAYISGKALEPVV